MPILRQPMLVRSVSSGTVIVNVVADALMDSALTLLQLQQLQAIIKSPIKVKGEVFPPPKNIVNVSRET